MDKQEKEYLVNQALVTKKSNGSNIDIGVQVVVRIVNASSLEEAIGKFIKATAAVLPTAQRLKVECEETKNYIKIS